MKIKAESNSHILKRTIEGSQKDITNCSRIKESIEERVRSSCTNLQGAQDILSTKSSEHKKLASDHLKAMEDIEKVGILTD